LRTKEHPPRDVAIALRREIFAKFMPHLLTNQPSVAKVFKSPVRGCLGGAAICHFNIVKKAERNARLLSAVMRSKRGTARKGSILEYLPTP
jgi:hypothetical protein